MNIEPYSRTDFEKARMTVQIISRFLIGLCEQGMLLYGVYIFLSKWRQRTYEPGKPLSDMSRYFIFRELLVKHSEFLRLLQKIVIS